MTSAFQPALFNRRLMAWIAGLSLSLAIAIATFVVSPFVVIALPVLTVVGLLLLRWPWLGVVLLVASVPAQQVGSVGGGSITLTRVAIVAAFVGLIVIWTFAGRPMVGSRLAVPFVGLIGWMLVTTHVASDISASSSEIVRWLISLFAFLAVLQVLVGATERLIGAFILAIAIVGALEAGFGTALGLLGLGPESFLIQDAFSRAYGTFGRPNTFAGYLEMAVFPVLWFGVYRWRSATGARRLYMRARRSGFASSAKERRDFILAMTFAMILLFSAAAMFGGILISFSRGAWIGVLAGLIVTLFVASRRFWHLIVPGIPILALTATIALTMFAPATLIDRVTSIADEARPFDAASITITPDNFAVVERMAHWQAGWRMFVDHPTTGIGAGNFNVKYPDYYVRETFRFSQGHAHNFYVHMLAENGIVGLAIYLTLILSFGFVALRVALSSTDRLSGSLALGALGTMVAVYVHNLFENLHVLNLGVQISFTWALAIAAHRRWASTHAATGDIGVEYSRK